MQYIPCATQVLITPNASPLGDALMAKEKPITKSREHAKSDVLSIM